MAQENLDEEEVQTSKDQWLADLGRVLKTVISHHISAAQDELDMGDLEACQHHLHLAMRASQNDYNGPYKHHYKPYATAHEIPMKDEQWVKVLRNQP
jgi:hypothetical protein